MNVRQLIEELKKFDEETPVLVRGGRCCTFTNVTIVRDGKHAMTKGRVCIE